MAFPTTSVLTTFTGADEDPLSEGGNWTGPILSGRQQCRRISNAAASNTTNTAQSYWTPSTFLETEVFATITQKATTNARWFDLYGRLTDPGTASRSDYSLEITQISAGTDTWDIWRHVNNTGSLLASLTATEVAVGDQVGMKITGTGATVTIEAWHKPAAGSWTLIGSFADTDANRRTAAGNIGIEFAINIDWRLDDFGGGEVVSAPGAGVTYKRFTGPAQLSGSAATLYTCPASTVARVLSIHASNPSGSPVDLNLSIGTDAAATRVYDGFAIAPNSEEQNFDPYDLAAGDTIQGFASTPDTLVLTITGYEQPA